MATTHERKALRSIAKLLADESGVLSRWRLVGRVMVILGWALVFYALLKAFEAPVVSRWLLLVGVAGGFLTAAGMWCSSAVHQWPIVAPFLDREALLRRARDAEA